MKKLKTAFYILLLATISISPAFADFQIWLGTGFISNTETIAEENRSYYQTFKEYYDERRPEGTPEMSLSDINSINLIGPSIDLSIYPYYEIPVGIKLTNQILFPVGINSKESYRTYSGDMKYRLLATLDYSQQYTSYFGMFAGFGIEYEYNHIAKTNKWNSTEKPDYHNFLNYGLYGEIGLLTTVSKGYFKIGIDYYHSLKNESSSYSMQLTGGYRF